MFRLDITIADNEDLRHVFRWVDRKGAPVELTGSTLMMHVKRTLEDKRPLLALDHVNGGLTVDQMEPFKFTMRLDRGSLAPGKYHFDIIQIHADGVRTRMAEGILTVEKGVTR